MRISLPLTILTAALLTAILLAAAWFSLNPPGPALSAASLSLSAISPNADGQADVTRIRYVLRRPASVSIYFLDAQGRRFDFRRDRQRASGEHSVDFAGVVAPYTLPGEALAGELLARVLPDGDYTWVIEAQEAGAAPYALRGELRLTGADTALPELLNLTASPAAFSPNQDGLNDRVDINVYLSKAVDPDGLHLFLIGPDGARLPIPEKVTALKPGERGLHAYDYDGGIDLGASPPPDGVYTVRAEVNDRVGQRMAAETQLTIQRGGLPRADIYRGEVNFSATTLQLGQTLYFTLTVENYSNAPLRTSGPASGYVYPSMSSNAAAAGWYDESGAWRVAIHCETCLRDYPWRWALGTPDSLSLLEENGRTYSYLMPSQRATVTGGIVLDQIVEARNPQYFWAGLIHEDVEIAPINNRVDPHFITILPQP